SMETMTILQWQYLIFVLPSGIAALLLLLSSLHLGHHTGHGLRMHGHAPAHGGHMPTAGHAAHAPAAHGHGAAHAPQSGHGHTAGHTARSAGVRHHDQATKRGTRRETERPNVSVTTNFVLQLTGADRAPLIMILEVFCLVWGVSGYLAN